MQAIHNGKFPIAFIANTWIVFPFYLVQASVEENMITQEDDYIIAFSMSSEYGTFFGYGGYVVISGNANSNSVRYERRADEYLTEINSNMIRNALGYTPYQKPASGIPKTDLAQSVQTSLNKADTAIQQINYDLGSPTFDADGYFALTQTQADEIQALWNNGLCSVSLVKDGITYLAFKDDTQTLNGVPFLVFIGNYYDASQGLNNVEVGRGFVAISTLAKMGMVIKYQDLNAGIVSEMIVDGFINYKNYEEPFPMIQGQVSLANVVNIEDSGRELYDYFWNRRGTILSLSFPDGTTRHLYSVMAEAVYHVGVREYELCWFGADKTDGAIYRVYCADANEYGQTVGTLTIYNQTRAITNAEIDAICI